MPHRALASGGRTRTRSRRRRAGARRAGAGGPLVVRLAIGARRPRRRRGPRWRAASASRASGARSRSAPAVSRSSAARRSRCAALRRRRARAAGRPLEHELHVDARGDLDARVVQPGAPSRRATRRRASVHGPASSTCTDGPAAEAGVTCTMRARHGAAGRRGQHDLGADDVVALLEDGGRERHDLAVERLGGPEVVRLLGGEVEDRDPAEHGLDGAPRSRVRVLAPCFDRALARRRCCCLGVSHAPTIGEPLEPHGRPRRHRKRFASSRPSRMVTQPEVEELSP